jgi:phosphatidylglycerophosphate synthase
MSNLEDLKRLAWKKSDAIIPRFLMRPLSIRITSLLIKTGLSPSHVTLFSFGLEVLAAFLFLQGLYLLSIAAAALLYFSHVFDCVDGEIARVKNCATGSGALLDIFLDRVGDVLVYSGVTLSLFTAGNDSALLLLGIFVIASILFQGCIGYRVGAIMKDAGVESGFSVGKDFYYGTSGIELVLLPASLARMLPEGMLVIGIVTSFWTVARFVAGYASLKRSESRATKATQN